MKKAIALVLLFTMALVSVMAGGSNEQAATKEVRTMDLGILLFSAAVTD